MSNVIICKECGKAFVKEVVEGAECPRCGYDNRNFFMKHKIITAILAIAIIGIVKLKHS